MKLSDIGEFGLIEKIQARFGCQRPEVTVSIGDDCAVFKSPQGEQLLVTTDLLVGGIHFEIKDIAPRVLGRKTLAVNISDIAAMGGIPLYFFVSIGIPRSLDTAFIEELYAGMEDLAIQHHMVLLGGDTTGSKHELIINVAVIGKTVNERFIKRKGACPGDLVQVSGPLGSSAAGLHILLHHPELKSRYGGLVSAHQDPRPRVNAGLVLSKYDRVTASIDISDGLLQDLGHICHQSLTGATIQARDIPVDPQVFQLADMIKADPWKWILSGGEDYELCWTVHPGAAAALIRDLKETAGLEHAATIGEITSDQLKTIRLRDRNIHFESFRGWDHFDRIEKEE